MFVYIVYSFAFIRFLYFLGDIVGVSDQCYHKFLLLTSSDVNAMFDYLEDLEKSRTDWRIKVRVTRLWPTSNAESGVVKGFNLILLDDDVS